MAKITTRLKIRPKVTATLLIATALTGLLLQAQTKFFAAPAGAKSTIARPAREVGMPLQLQNKIVWMRSEKYRADNPSAMRPDGIFAMRPDGTHQVRLMAVKGSNPTISPNGRRIAFKRSHGVWIMNWDGTALREVAKYAESPAFSPDGRKITFMVGGRDPHGPSHDFDIVVKNIGNATIRNLTHDNEINDTQPVFSPDSKKIVFASGNFTLRYDFQKNEEYRDIFVIGADGTQKKQLTTDAQDDSEPTFSPDGKHIAFVRGRYVFNGDFYIEAQIYIMNADGTQQKRLIGEGTNNFAPTFSPDGKHIAFVSDRDGNKEIYVMNANGSNQKRLTNSPDADDVSPIWRGSTHR